MMEKNKEIKSMSSGEMIKYIRVTSGLSQKQLGKMINMSDTTISAYERGIKNISLKTFLKITCVCDFDIKVFVTDKESTETFNIVVNEK
jgi:transcriptional regulator with XRE-family HTH domain